ncbi:MAG TPA: hypothetical protein VND15_01175 [Candidatus Acidoferrales bacterium]|nr:hypothetical protein [Candidatus Acidoferrales bacterium]
MKDIMQIIDEARIEFADIELALKNEDEAQRLRARPATRAVFLRLPTELVAMLDRAAEEDGRNRQSYIIKLLKGKLS